MCTAPCSMTLFTRKQYPNAVIGAIYSNAMIWLVRDTYPNAAIWLMRGTYPNVAIWLVRDNTLIRRSDWCKQHTTLYANIELLFLYKKITQKWVTYLRQNESNFSFSLLLLLLQTSTDDCIFLAVSYAFDWKWKSNQGYPC